MRVSEALQFGDVARHQSRCDALRKMQGEQFFVGVAQAARIVYYLHARALREFQHHRVVEELGIEGRILARENHIDLAQILPLLPRRA